MVKRGFSEVQRIEFENRIDEVGLNNVQTNLPKRMHPIIYMLITNKYATYKELRDEYNVYETLTLYESCMISNYNKHVIQKELRSKDGRI